VFKQDAPSKPHQAVGSVHAGDAEHALFTARTVFVRRPSAVSLWVAPAKSILAVTLEQLERGQIRAEPDDANLELQTFLIFRKTHHKRSMTFVDFVGELPATGAMAALGHALERFTDAPALAWWIVPERDVIRSQSDSETRESWFDPARDKTYRQQSHYATVGSHASKHNPRAKTHDDV
jgi:ring-1,2-phenylacetyl-CoA epoxidase subunit PaaB